LPRQQRLWHIDADRVAGGVHLINAADERRGASGGRRSPLIWVFGERFRCGEGRLGMRRSSWLLANLSVLFFFAGPVLHAAEPSLVGSWRFEKEVDSRADGTRVTVGPKDGYNGFLVYTTGGRMMVQIMPRGRTWRRTAVTPEQLRETVEAGDAYFGRYTIDSSAGTVTHHVEGSLDPSEEGTQLTRRFRLIGDTLVLAGSWEYGGETLGFEITWSRQQ
jgi:hypothetical protein